LDAAKARPDWSSDPRNSTLEAHIAFGTAALLEARGQFLEAAMLYRRAEGFFRESLTKLRLMRNPPLRSNVEQVCDWMTARAARVEARAGHLVDAEIDARQALLNWLKLGGKYNLNTARIIGVFANILVEQARYAEAEQLTRSMIEIYQALGAERDSQVYAIGLNQLAGILALQGHWTEAAKTYVALSEATRNWEISRREEVGLDVTRILTAYEVNDLVTGVELAQRLLARQAARFGERHLETALARGVLATGFFRAGREADALREFAVAAPLIISGMQDAQSDDDDAVANAAREQRIQYVMETYLNLLARGGNAAPESLVVAETIRGHSVQKALTEASARATARDPDLAELARTEQDLQKQASAQLGALNNMLALSPAERDEKAVAVLRGEIAELRTRHTAVRADLAARFPGYADLVNPKPPSIDQIAASLTSDEAVLSFYFGMKSSFVWTIRKSQPALFVQLDIAPSDVTAKVTRLRAALEPQAAMISDIPPFDIDLAHQLYAALLKPVEDGWKPAGNLIVVTNGALGLLPLSLLPTAPAQLDSNEEPLFANYRAVPWLARTHGVTVMPSASALLTLRKLPAGSSSRKQFIAFGDPYFNREQADQAKELDKKVEVADASNVRRGLALKRRNSPQLTGVDSAQLGLLPRLPDTSEELRSIALALRTDPAKVLNLGMEASEKNVKATDLSDFKVIAFATHGLVPGELDGLTQPALALSSPAVTGNEGDGLLTMEEVLGLKLDADWVVLSACNTGAGAGAGAEAASGLGLAFFYAGTRALLVTNWSVHSQSARELVTDLFKRQADDPKLTRGEALRQAMMALADGPGYVGVDGKTEFAYAHPLFWAPYSIIGDGGGR
jgi:CHAT domain-containing protein